MRKASWKQYRSASWWPTWYPMASIRRPASSGLLASKRLQYDETISVSKPSMQLSDTSLPIFSLPISLRVPKVRMVTVDSVLYHLVFESVKRPRSSYLGPYGLCVIRSKPTSKFMGLCGPLNDNKHYCILIKFFTRI